MDLFSVVNDNFVEVISFFHVFVGAASPTVQQDRGIHGQESEGEVCWEAADQQGYYTEWR